MDPLLDYLLHYLALQDAGCPLERHELTDELWNALAAIRAEREKLSIEKAREDGKH